MIINGITTLALIGSVILLVRTLPTHRSSPLQLLRAGGLLWLTNVIARTVDWRRMAATTVRHRKKKRSTVSFPRCNPEESAPNLPGALAAVKIICLAFPACIRPTDSSQAAARWQKFSR
jgi:hypothetical protein